MTHFHFRPAILLLIVLLVGCGQSEATVSGTVRVDGQPLSLPADGSAVVTFHPVGGGRPVAYGAITNDGRYQLQVGRDPGASAGDYTVTIRATQLIADPSGFNAPAPKHLIPQRYAEVATTDQRKTVKQGANVIDIELSSR